MRKHHAATPLQLQPTVLHSAVLERPERRRHDRRIKNQLHARLRVLRQSPKHHHPYSDAIHARVALDGGWYARLAEVHGKLDLLLVV